MGISNFVQLLHRCGSDGMYTIVSFIHKGVFPIIQIGIPIILIVMGSIDLGKAVISSDEKEIKASQGRLIKRCISAVAVFFVATIVEILFGLFGQADTDIEAMNWSECWKDTAMIVLPMDIQK